MASRATSGARVLGSTVVAVWVALAVAGCATVRSWDILDKKGHLEEIQRQYSQSIRWGAFEKARVFVAKDARDRWDADKPLLADVRFTEYEIQTSEVDIEKMTATFRVTYTGYQVNSLIEHTVDEKQDWFIDPDTNEWQVRPDLIVLRAGVVGTKP